MGRTVGKTEYVVRMPEACHWSTREWLQAVPKENKQRDPKAPRTPTTPMTQSQALDILKTGVNVFLTGEPGSGKTHTINQYVAWLRTQHKKVAMTASTGIAATHINGMTIHSWSGIGIKRTLKATDVDEILRNDFKRKGIMDADVLIIDEISMLDAKVINMVDTVLRRARNFMNDAPFGGVQVVFVGDFFQLPPVGERVIGGRPLPVTKFAFESESWAAASPLVCYLTEQHRQEDEKFLDILTAMRSGGLRTPHVDALKSRADIPYKISETTVLYTHNADVDHENNLELAKIEEEPHVYDMSSTGHEYPIQLLKKQCLSPEHLELKTGALVMFTRNNWDTGYVNGTIGTVIDFLTNGAPVVETKAGKQIVVLEAEWKFVNASGSTTASIRQLPLRLAWAMTVHKSQGMSLDQAHIDLSRAFEFGQGYVALSRVRSLAGLSLAGFNKKALQMHPTIVKADAEFRKLSQETMEKYHKDI